MKRVAGSLLGLALAATVVTQAPAAQAAGSSATTYCSTAFGSITADGGHILRAMTATTPPTTSAATWGGQHLLPDGQTRVAAGLGFEVTGDYEGMSRRQYVVLGTQLYHLTYDVKGIDGDVIPGSVKQTLVGGGWGDMRYLENSKYNAGGKLVRQNAYAVQGDKIRRWTINGAAWQSKQTYAGFSAVKTMALISQTATYDTFLANTYSGSLYTIRIPASGAPVVKVVRRSTWQGFEQLVADKCGNQGTLLVAIDKDNGAPYLYALGHANGLSTVIQGFGKANRTLVEPAFFRYYDDTETYGQLFGE